MEDVPSRHFTGFAFGVFEILGPEQNMKITTGVSHKTHVYRPYIDSLRAMAVFAVVLYHAKIAFSRAVSSASTYSSSFPAI